MPEDGVKVKYRRRPGAKLRSDGIRAMRQHMKVMPGAIMGTPGVRKTLEIGCKHVEDRVYAQSFQSFKDDTGVTRKTIRYEILRGPHGYPIGNIIAGGWSMLLENGWTTRAGRWRDGKPFVEVAVGASKATAGNLMAAYVRAKQNQIMRDTARIFGTE